MADTNTNIVPIWFKYALTIEEASEYFHIGKNKLHDIVNDNKDAPYLLWIGNHVLIKRERFAEALDKQSAI